MLSKEQVIKNLNNINIDENFIIIHSDITGLVYHGFSISELWEIIYNSFGKNKTYIFPTFNFNFSKNNVWHYYKSTSQTGVLSEYFRKNISKIRTIHPIHSVCLFGKKYSEIPSHKSSSSFGRGSVWEWISTSKDVCNIGLGLNLDGGGTFVHYAEEKVNVSYRHKINLNIKVFDSNNKLVKKKFSYFARKPRLNVINDWNKCEKKLIKKNLLEQFIFPENNYKIIKMNTYKVTKFLIKNLKENPKYLLK